MKNCRLKHEWYEFINLPPRKQLLEQAFAIMMQWFLLRIVTSVPSILAEYDEFLDAVWKHFEKDSSFSVEQLYLWSHSNINDNQWDVDKARKILHVIHDVINTKYGYLFITDRSVYWLGQWEFVSIPDSRYQSVYPFKRN